MLAIGFVFLMDADDDLLALLDQMPDTVDELNALVAADKEAEDREDSQAKVKGDIDGGDALAPATAAHSGGAPATAAVCTSQSPECHLLLVRPSQVPAYEGLFTRIPDDNTSWAKVPPGVIDLTPFFSMSSADTMERMFDKAVWLIRMEDFVEWKVGYTQAVDKRYQGYRYGTFDKPPDTFSHMVLLGTFHSVDTGLMAERSLIINLHAMGFTMRSRHIGTRDRGGNLPKASRDPHMPTIYLMLRKAAVTDPCYLPGQLLKRRAPKSQAATSTRARSENS